MDSGRKCLGQNDGPNLVITKLAKIKEIYQYSKIIIIDLRFFPSRMLGLLDFTPRGRCCVSVRYRIFEQRNDAAVSYNQKIASLSINPIAMPEKNEVKDNVYKIKAEIRAARQDFNEQNDAKVFRVRHQG